LSTLPSRAEQIRIMHAPFIRQVVQLGQSEANRPELETVLSAAVDNGWSQLVQALRKILAGRREPSVLVGLDEEDQVIAEAVIRGLQNPSSLPEPVAQPSGDMAARGLASMIQKASAGNVQALQIISNMADQMRQTGGPMARLAGAIRPLINGERDPRKLCRGMDTHTERLVLSILEELSRQGRH
jgi:hypothetical protein